MEAASKTKATMHSPVMEDPTLSWVRDQINTGLSWGGVGRTRRAKTWRMKRTEVTVFISRMQKLSVGQ